MIDADTQATIDAASAAADHAQLVGDHAGRAAHATAALAAMTAAYHPVPGAEPTDAVGAAARLEHLQKSAAWRDKYFSGDVATRAEFDNLNGQIAAGDATDLALAGHKPASTIDENSGSIVSEHDLAAGVGHLRDVGFPDSNIAEIFRGTLL